MDQIGHKAGHRIELPMRRADIADYLGLQPETVSRELRALERQGLTTLESACSIHLHDVQSIKCVAEIP